jgi:3-oxoacyl-[acyl-carrier protein] reductase
MDFKDKIVFVTAAAGAGIGQAVARTFASEGATVVISDQHAERTEKVAAQIADDTGQDVTGYACDVRDEDRIDEVIGSVVDKYGQLDVVVNNSGINQLAPLHEMPTDTWRHVIDVSLTGPFLVTRRALSVMRQQRSGAIVNMSSIAGWMRPAEGESHYAAAKAGIQGFTRAAAMEAAPFGIRVNAVAPGLAWNAFLAKIYSEEYVEEMARQTPLGRAGTPQDVANAVAFLASDKASFITGEVLCVAGGYYLHT